MANLLDWHRFETRSINIRAFNFKARSQNRVMISHMSDRLEYPLIRAASTDSESMKRKISAPTSRSANAERAITGSQHLDRHDLRSSLQPPLLDLVRDDRCELSGLFQAPLKDDSTNPIWTHVTRSRIRREAISKDHRVGESLLSQVDLPWRPSMNQLLPLLQVLCEWDVELELSARRETSNTDVLK